MMSGIARSLHRSTATKIGAPELILWGSVFFRAERSAPMSGKLLKL